MPTDLPVRFEVDLTDPATQAGYIADAVLTDDPMLVSHAIKEIATLRGLPCALGANPPLGEVIRALRELGFALSVSRLGR